MFSQFTKKKLRSYLVCFKMESKFRVKCSMLIIFIIVTHIHISSGCIEDERLSLLHIKTFFLSHISNKSLDPLPSWVGADCCLWEGVTCNNNYTSPRHVVELLVKDMYRFYDSHYSYRELNFSLNVSLFQNFKELKSLDLYFNGFGGFTENKGFNEFPSLNRLETLNLGGNCLGNNVLLSLSGLMSLKKLVLSPTCMEGSISLPGLINLRELDLSFNDLNGFNGFPSLNRLETLNLGGNCFGNNILLSLSGLTSLKKLVLSRTCLEGSISLPGLIHLRELDLSSNDLNGSDGFSSLKRLEILNLDGNGFNNSIFSSLRGLTSLKTLTFSGNDWKRSISAQIIPTQDIAKLESLEILDLGHNEYYSGVIPLQDLKNLRVLDLSYNHFDTVPIQGFCNTNNLVELNVPGNQITGQFSECIGNFSRLRFLDISMNKFTGKIPTTISNLTSIVYLFLHENYFEGPFSFSSLANLSKLKYFKLSGSNVANIQVETEEPKWEPTFQLKVLKLPNCNLNRQTASNIPTFLLSQRELQFIDLSHNQLFGTCPLWLLHNNSRLEVLYLSDNSFTGALQFPSWKQHSLFHLQISDNHFNGPLPNHMGFLLPNLEFFLASRNSFEGNLPPSMEQMEHLKYLDLSNNNFSGSLQISVFNKMPQLEYLFLASNNFSGSIEDGWKIARGFYALDISNNMLSGKIPSWIGSLEGVQYVQMSKNLFVGELPVEICSLDNLEFLDVSHNQLIGGIPSCFNSSRLFYLYMQKNSLSGPIPDVLMSTASELSILDLSYNHFSGHIPNWFENFTRLRILLLKENELQGSIPRQLCQVGEISIMDLSNNNLSGSIPSCLNNIKFGMIEGKQTTLTLYPRGFIALGHVDDEHLYTQLSSNYEFSSTLGLVEVSFTTKHRFDSFKGNILDYMSGLDLSSNQLTGNIPQQIGDLRQIRALNFSHNKLLGPIPKEISNLKQLESLDLSNNLLSGNIPPELVGLNSLAIFNVSYNNLSGMIPTSAQFLTYPASSFYGNYYLCGSYIEHKCTIPLLKFGEDQHEAFIDLEAFYWSFVASYFTILLGFVAVLCINRQWRQTWFYFIEVFCSYFCECI